MQKRTKKKKPLTYAYEWVERKEGAGGILTVGN